jgi:hypothetical protein
MSPEENTMGTIRRWVRDRRGWAWMTGGLAAIGLVAATAVALSGDGREDTAAIQDESTMSSTTSTPTTTTTAVPTTTAPPTTTGTAHATTTTRPPATTTAASPGVVPEAVTVIEAMSGGGSGEIEVQWDAVTGATGYRVLRSAAGGGPFAVVADYDMATGHATTFDDHITVWHPSDQGWLQYVEYGDAPRTRWFCVVAYNDAGDAPPSAVVSGSPPAPA